MKRADATILTIIALVALPILASPAAAQDVDIERATLAEKNAKTPEVSTGQLRQILTDGSAIVLDTRSRAEFDSGHIPGARNLDAAPDQQIAAVEKLVDGNKAAALVMYCNGPYCQASRRLGEQLAAVGFSNVRRYQLGIPVWRALGGPTVVELSGIVRIFNVDRTAVYLDARTSEAFAKGSLAGARNVPVEDVASGKLKKIPLPEDDFNRRIVLFGDGEQARKLADVLSKRPWHNVAYFSGSFEVLAASVKGK
jgi:rhodanese-related sulfurtransferase